jgi:hypothetical protein
MTTVFKINSNGLVESFLNKYRIWTTAKNFYDGPHSPVVEHATDGIPCYHHGDVAGINSNNNKIIAVDCLTEGIHCKSFFERYNKSNKYLIFSNGTWDKAYYDLGIDYEIVYHKFFLFEMADTYNTPIRFCFYLDKEYKFDEAAPYVFVSTIGNVRPERDYLINQLTSRLEYKNYLIRYSGQDINGNGDVDVIKVRPGNFDPYTHIIDSYYHTVSQTLPIKLFNQGRFNLIVESDLNWQNEFFLTEKTIKNLITGMPFVSVSTPYFLKNLKALGFETYSSVWDESYDDVEDYAARVDKIVALCNNLSTFDWGSAKTELIRIGNHNRLRFLSLNAEAEKEFLEFENIIKGLEL